MMKKYHLATFALLTLLLGANACGPGAIPENVPTQAPTQPPLVVSPTQPPALPETATPTVEPALEYQPFRTSMFVTSDTCTACHNGMTDEAGNDVSNGTQWQASMMAQAARDPYYLATISSEVNEHPELRSVIEDKCAPCHMPMAHFATQAAGGETYLLGEDGFLAAGNPIKGLAEDGVSCTACHQITPETLEQDDPTSGHLIFDTETEKGQRLIYGQFLVAKDTSRMMTMTSGFIPIRSKHISDSRLCGTCHTLYTPYLLEDGSLSETLFPEQTVYLEWENSDFQESASCQNCHMPAAEGKVAPSSIGGEPRSPFSQHRFSGGNAYMLRILQKIGETKDIGASTDDFETAITETVSLLQTQTADLRV
ncbi:MAG: cytochrome c family protein [Anaerolineales bacterium]|nr:cytochrome c family protein [Anaerolineales bacterium]